MKPMAVGGDQANCIRYPGKVTCVGIVRILLELLMLSSAIQIDAKKNFCKNTPHHHQNRELFRL